MNEAPWKSTQPLGARPGSLWARNGVAIVAAFMLMNGCALLPKLNRIDPHADFVAHPGYHGLVVDRTGGGHTALLVQAHSTPPSGGPTHVFEMDGKPAAALWVTDHDHVIVRQTADASAPPAGDVAASWKDGAIQLTFHSADGESFHTSQFDRIEGPTFRNVLDREMYAIRDLPGVYGAELRDEHDAPVGWVRVRILPYQGLPRDYQADVPKPLDGPLTAGAVALLDSEIATIIDLNAFPDDRMPEGLVP
jgi:hypothetical protein